MDSVARIRRTMAFQACDRPPVIAQVFAHAALACGRSVDAYVASGVVAAACQIEARARYGYDAVFAVLDLTLEAEAAGGEVQSRRGVYPAVARPPLAPDDDFRRLTIPDPRTAGRLPMALEMATCLRDACGDEALVVGLVQGPMTLAVQFLGIEKALFLAADDPDRFLQLLDYTAAVGKAFGLAQLAAGAHLVLVFEPAACPEVVPPGLFREMIGPRLKWLFGAFTKAGAIGNWLHIAGKTGAVLPHYVALGADIGNFDYCVDPEALLEALGDSRLCLDGNIKSLSFVTDSAADVEREARQLLNVFDRRGGFILSSGCEIPPESQEATIAAMVRTALAWKSGQSEV
ncbi:MAG TPA: uroporphyrinogen decarboxylase family protein [Anaeromyxobacteraceae bacterium]|nr:uroporphyrinogen decarboxylase family protein [Anaeromyxobacteraceae bacterium]